MNTVFWIIMAIVDVFFLLIAFARAGTHHKEIKEKIELEESISTIITVIIAPLISIGILISTIQTITAIWS